MLPFVDRMRVVLDLYVGTTNDNKEIMDCMELFMFNLLADLYRPYRSMKDMNDKPNCCILQEVALLQEAQRNAMANKPVIALGQCILLMIRPIESLIKDDIMVYGFGKLLECCLHQFALKCDEHLKKKHGSNVTAGAILMTYFPKSTQALMECVSTFNAIPWLKTIQCVALFTVELANIVDKSINGDTSSDENRNSMQVLISFWITQICNENNINQKELFLNRCLYVLQRILYRISQGNAVMEEEDLFAIPNIINP